MRLLAAAVVTTMLLPAPARALPIFGPDELVLGTAAVSAAGVAVGFTVLAVDEDSRGVEMKDDPLPFAAGAVVAAALAVVFTALAVRATES